MNVREREFLFFNGKLNRGILIRKIRVKLKEKNIISRNKEKVKNDLINVINGNQEYYKN